MAAILPVPITPLPGVVVTESDRVAEGRFIAPFDKVEFVKGRLQKIGGNVRVTATAMSGTPRATHCWRDFLANQYVACGTYRKLYAFDSSYNLNDITPFSSTGSLGNNPFTTTSGSSSVSVHHVGHGRNVGDTAIYAGATAVHGVSMNSTFIVSTVTGANDYTVNAGINASGSGAGGGAGVTFEYEISIGTELGAYGQGWGVGPWGLGTWGTARGSSTIFYEPRVWSLDHFGVVLLATYNGGTLWSFDPTQAQPWGRAVSTFGGTPMNAPADFRAMFITPERFVVGLCDAMVVKVCSQSDPTTWTPSSSNTAFQRTLQEGTKLVSGRVLAPFISMIWTDAAAYIFQYTGSQFVYNSSLAGKDCGLISPNAAVTVDGIAYWMGNDNFYSYNGSVAPMPNVDDIRRYVFDNVPVALAFQCCGIYVPKYHSIYFFYPATPTATNPTNYVIYHIVDQCWSIGTADFYSSGGVTGGAIAGTGTVTEGTGYSASNYNNVPLTGGSGSGATANFTTEDGVTGFTLVLAGLGYAIDDVLSADTANLGGFGGGFSVPVTAIGPPFTVSGATTAARASGSHFTQGDTSPIMAATDGFLYNHYGIGDTYDDNGNPLTWTATIAPYALSEGLQNVDVEGILWDFFEQSGNVSATVNTYDRLTDLAPMDTDTEIVPDVEAGLTDYRVSGRYVGLTLTSSDLGSYIRWGKPVAFVRPSARRR